MNEVHGVFQPLPTAKDGLLKKHMTPVREALLVLFRFHLENDGMARAALQYRLAVSALPIAGGV